MPWLSTPRRSARTRHRAMVAASAAGTACAVSRSTTSRCASSAGTTRTSGPYACVRTMHASLAAVGSFTFREVADGVVVAVARPGPHPDCNAVLVDLGGEVLVVDAHARRSSAEAVAAFAARRFDAPIRTLVDTHHHWDHWQGNRVYVAGGARVLAHPAAIAALRAGAPASIAEQRSLVQGLREGAFGEDAANLEAYEAELAELSA